MLLAAALCMQSIDSLQQSLEVYIVVVVLCIRL
jgi:hypothetical protein